MDTIGDRISYVRKKNDLSMEEFGKRISISRGAVNNLEKGTNNPSEQTIAMISKEFGINPQFLKSGELPIELPPEVDKEDELVAALKKNNCSDFVIEIIKNYNSMSDEFKQEFEKMVCMAIQKK